MRQYTFPETDIFKARDVLEATFDIRPYLEDLYVHLDEVRGEEQLDDLCFQLGIQDDKLVAIGGEPQKILFSGHRGCGKSLELYRYHRRFDHPDRYLSIHIDLQQELEASKFEPEDLFVLMIAKLIQKLAEQGLDFDKKTFDKIAEDWLSEEDVKAELKNTSGFDYTGEASVGFNFWNFVSFKQGLKDLVSGSRSTISSIRTKVKLNSIELIEAFNTELGNIRAQLAQSGHGKDILFIIDGSERVRREVYERMFVHDINLIRSTQVSMICAVPINTFYEIVNTPGRIYFQRITLPMIKITPESRVLLEQIVTKRVSKDVFFEQDALNYMIDHSGGCPQQMLLLVQRAIVKTRGKKITRLTAEAVVREFGRRLYEELNEKHLELIRQGGDKGEYLTGEFEVQQLLFSLALLKYNGDIYINPALKPFVQHGNPQQ
jgi:hypothetical protein